MKTITLEVRTSARDQMIDLTDRIRSFVAASGMRDGLVHIHVPHTTAAVTINENADPDVIHDMLAALDVAVLWRQGFYRHGEGNSAAHVKSSLVGCGISVPVVDGRMALGTWQGIFFCEFDGPRTRSVLVSAGG
jgi:secondary thiamine-phosphate synthase enzyme